MTTNKGSVQNRSDQVPGAHIPIALMKMRGLLKNEESSHSLSANPDGKDESNRLKFEAVAHARRPGEKIVSLHAYAKSKGVKMMSQDEKEIKLEAFKAENVTSFCEELEDDNWALRAFGVLLESSSLNHFSEDQYDDAWLYRKGLRNIVELYLDRQEQKLNEIKSRSVTTPEWMIHQAEVTCNFTRQGAWNSHEVALENTRQKIQTMNQVITTFGAEEYPKAQKVLDSLLDLQDGIKSRIDAQKVAKIAEDADYRQARAARLREAEA
jgi:hypothetical protein